MSDEKRLLKHLLIYLFLFSNKKEFNLYNIYDWNEVEDKLVIKIDQDDRALKFSIADNISKVYSLSKIHKCINSQKLLKIVIDINAI